MFIFIRNSFSYLLYFLLYFVSAPKVTGKLSKIYWKKYSAKQVYDLHRAVSHKYILSTSWFTKPVRLYNIELDHESRLDKKLSDTSSSSSSHKSALNFLNSSNTVNSINNDDVRDNISPGIIDYDRTKQILKVQCSDGNWIKCSNFKVSNGRIMSVADFYNGFLSKKDKTDWFFE